MRSALVRPFTPGCPLAAPLLLAYTALLAAC